MIVVRAHRAYCKCEFREGACRKCAYCKCAFVAARRRANARFPGVARTDPKGKNATGSVVELSYTAFASIRAHADQVFADLIEGTLNHLPSREFDVNAVWPQLAGTRRHGPGPSAPWPQPAIPWRVAPPSVSS